MLKEGNFIKYSQPHEHVKVEVEQYQTTEQSLKIQEYLGNKVKVICHLTKFGTLNAHICNRFNCTKSTCKYHQSEM